MIGAIFCETRPAIIIRSDCRGDPRNTSAPKREMSKRDALMDIISIAQQANPKVIGQIEDLRAQLMAMSRVVKTTPSASIGRFYRKAWDKESASDYADYFRMADNTRVGNAGPIRLTAQV